MSRKHHGKGLYFEPPNRWRYKFRFAGKGKFMSLGYGISIEEAKMEMERAKSLINKGINPILLRKAERELLRSDNVYLNQSRLANVFLKAFESKEEAIEFLQERQQL